MGDKCTCGQTVLCICGKADLTAKDEEIARLREALKKIAGKCDVVPKGLTPRNNVIIDCYEIAKAAIQEDK